MVRIGLALSLLLLLLSSRLAAQERPLQDAIAAGFKAGDLAGLHSVLVMQKGEILAENHFEGSDWSWARSLGVRQHGPKTLHDIRSVTKSIIGLLYGIALAEGKVPGLGKSLIAQFPEYADLARDQKRRAIRVEHTLSMKMGTEWNEALPYSDPRNSEIAMERAKDRYRFALDRKMVSEPGSQWVYNGGAVALIAALIQRGTGLPIDKYAEAKLFKPLGISRYEWIRGRDGVPSAASGLRMTIHDLAKIGTLVLQKGKFDGKQIVPASWLSTSFTPRSDLRSGLRYGYLWWLAAKSWGDPPSWVAGFGNGGQRLTVQGKNGLVLVVFAGNYNRRDAWKLPVRIINKYMVPEIKRRLAK